MEAWWAQKTLDDMWFCYNNQHDDSKNIPPIDMEKCEGDIIFKIYSYAIPTKYYTRVFPDPDSDFMMRLMETMDKDGCVYDEDDEPDTPKPKKRVVRKKIPPVPPSPSSGEEEWSSNDDDEFEIGGKDASWFCPSTPKWHV